MKRIFCPIGQELFADEEFMEGETANKEDEDEADGEGEDSAD